METSGKRVESMRDGNNTKTNARARRKRGRGTRVRRDAIQKPCLPNSLHCVGVDSTKFEGNTRSWRLPGQHGDRAGSFLIDQREGFCVKSRITGRHRRRTVVALGLFRQLCAVHQPFSFAESAVAHGALQWVVTRGRAFQSVRQGMADFGFGFPLGREAENPTVVFGTGAESAAKSW